MGGRNTALKRPWKQHHVLTPHEPAFLTLLNGVDICARLPLQRIIGPPVKHATRDTKTVFNIQACRYATCGAAHKRHLPPFLDSQVPCGHCSYTLFHTFPRFRSGESPGHLHCVTDLYPICWRWPFPLDCPFLPPGAQGRVHVKIISTQPV
ncbi:hypothetical protein Micbo1qcDRAFT_25079 [Microdochium bolleyi]|uniref:Uncharacterized protein n=1 Tax=Microdochium bolleyi TaxID=196109 RepID=A0A136JDK7_9PEZI|nr:hypothetical protein Micbo1qcDRAFT_25079 [Microdochium bolleyi]